MSSSSEWDEGPPLPPDIARSLSLAGMVLLVLFLTIVAGSLFPIALLDPAWQLRLGGALINSSPVPLTGLALLHLATAIDAGDPLLARRRNLAARLAVPVALGFLLLLPLLSTAAVQQQVNQARQQSARLSRATSQLEALRTAVRAASSPEDLDQRLARLQGPRLESRDQGLALPELRRRVNAALDQAAGEIARQKQALPPANPWRLAPEVLRTSVACLALATGFAGLAARASSEVSLLTELLWSWESLGRRPARSIGQRPTSAVTPDQINQWLDDDPIHPQDDASQP